MFQVTDSKLSKIYSEMKRIKNDGLNISKLFNNSINEHQFDDLYRLLEKSTDYINIDMLFDDYRKKYNGNLSIDVFQEMLLMLHDSKTKVIKFKNI